MNYKITIDPYGKISVETSNTTGPNCLKLSELVRDATGGTLQSLQHKSEFYEPDEGTAHQHIDTSSLEQSA